MWVFLESSKATGIREIIEDQSWLGATNIEVVKMHVQASVVDVSGASGME